MKPSSVNDWRVFSAFVVVTVLLVFSEFSVFSSSVAGFTSEAMAQSLFAYGRHSDNLVAMVSALFLLSLVIAGIMLAFRKPVFAFAFLTTIFAHNGLSFYASSIVTQPLPGILVESTSSGFLVFAALSMVFFELSQYLKKGEPPGPIIKSLESGEISPSKVTNSDKFTRMGLLQTVAEIAVVSIVFGLLVTLAAGLSLPSISFPSPLLNVGTNVGGSLRLTAGLFGGFILAIIVIRFLLANGLRWFVSRKRNAPSKIHLLEKVHRRELLKDLANLFYLQNELKYFVRRTPTLIVIPKRRDVTLILLPLFAMVGAYAAVGIIFSLGVFSGQVESLKIGYQDTVIPFDNSLYDLEQNSNVSDNVFSTGAEVVGAGINDFLAEVANAVDTFFRTAIL